MFCAAKAHRGILPWGLIKLNLRAIYLPSFHTSINQPSYHNRNVSAVALRVIYWLRNHRNTSLRNIKKKVFSIPSQDLNNSTISIALTRLILSCFHLHSRFLSRFLHPVVVKHFLQLCLGDQLDILPLKTSVELLII